MSLEKEEFSDQETFFFYSVVGATLLAMYSAVYALSMNLYAWGSPTNQQKYRYTMLVPEKEAGKKIEALMYVFIMVRHLGVLL